MVTVRFFHRIKLFLPVVSVMLTQHILAQNPQLQPLAGFGTNGNGSILPGERPYLTDGSTNNGSVHELQRSMAYNATTGHLLLLSRTNLDTGDSYYIAIIDATTGADVGNLGLGIPGIGADTGFNFNTIGVADDGAIYVCDLSSKTTTTGVFNLYRWASESGSMVQIFGSDPSGGDPNAGNNRDEGPDFFPRHFSSDSDADRPNPHRAVGGDEAADRCVQW
jgi:hypothetical protein